MSARLARAVIKKRTKTNNINASTTLVARSCGCVQEHEKRNNNSCMQLAWLAPQEINMNDPS